MSTCVNLEESWQNQTLCSGDLQRAATILRRISYAHKVVSTRGSLLEPGVLGLANSRPAMGNAGVYEETEQLLVIGLWTLHSHFCETIA